MGRFFSIVVHLLSCEFFLETRPTRSGKFKRIFKLRTMVRNFDFNSLPYNCVHKNTLNSRSN